ncbi:CotH kinase family protein [Rufibacter latericius]|uniref:Spore coat protein CotH n=1 Tax=Rufibacter latericius TaxID=2487040 RepID=A0A3M9MN59_9BACT|nr:CotH kinase family protein [Rufibacter latericius]RNI26976.1 hypothetical protein EFB08_10955 [Rufibacter latericius]
MKKQLLFFVYIFFLISSCQQDQENSFNEIIKFQAFNEQNAHSLKEIIDFKIQDQLIEAVVPYGTKLTNMVATFSTTGHVVRIKDVVQESGVTINDFSQPLEYTVEAEDGSTRVYRVVVKQESGSSNATFTSFKFEVKNNTTQLLEDVVCQIIDDKIIGIIPYTSSVESMVATFTTNGKVVKVVDALQLSGVTPNNFTHGVQYAIEAEDGTIKNYTVELHVFTGLPLVYIDTENRAPILNKENYVSGQMKLSGVGASFKGDIQIKGRGNSTWNMPKKPFKIKLKEKASLLGMPADKEWALLANYADKSLMRNAVAFELSKRFGLAYTPKAQFVEVILNGEYLGNYLLTETVKVSKDRVNITEMKSGDVSEEAISGGYLLEVDERLDETFWFRSSRNVPITIKSPEDIVPQQLNYIKDYIGNTEKAIFSATFTDPVTGYANYIDVESFINWYLVNELLKNRDAAFYSSVFLYKERNKKLFLGPVWDFDIAMGNVTYDNNDKPEGWWIKNSIWMNRLFEDPAFRKKVKDRWSELKREEVNTIFTYINSTAGKLKYSQKENFEKWDLLDNYTWPNAVVTGSYENEVQYLKSWLQRRINWLDSEINRM